MSKKYEVVVLYMGEPRSPGGCEIYRGNMPAWYLGEQSKWTTHWLYYSDIMQAFAGKGVGPMAQYWSRFDLVVFPRFYADSPKTLAQIEQFFIALRRIGLKLAYEVDDDFTNDHRKVLPDGASAINVAKLCDAITVSTPVLGEMMREKTGRPYHVLPNCIDPRLWRKATREANGREVTIGLTGSATHFGDWKVLEDVLPAIIEKHPHVTLVSGAYLPEYLQGIPRTRIHPPLPYDQYADVIKASDIVLAPLDTDDNFNLYKSGIKAIEGMGAARKVKGQKVGAAVLATDHPVYERVINHASTGLLVPQEESAWYDALDMLITNAEMREGLQANAFQWVWKHRNMAKTWKLWDKAYRTILAN